MSHASTNSLPTARTRPSICAIVTTRLSLRRLAGQLRRGLPVLGDPVQIDVGDEVVRIAARVHAVVCLGHLHERDEVPNELRTEQVHGRREDLGEQHAALPVHGERLECELSWG